MTGNNGNGSGDLKRPILMIVVSLAAVFLYHVAGKIIGSFIKDDFLAAFLAEVAFAVLVVIIVIAFKKKYIFRSDRSLLKGNRRCAALIIVVSIYLLLTGLAGLTDTGLKASPAQILLLAGQCVLVGFCEETLFRGIIQREFHDYFGEDSFKHVFLAILCAGIVFGLAHMVNIDRGISFMSVALQAEINIFAGIYYSSVFFRTGKNIPFMIFLHAFYDFSTMIYNGRLGGGSLNSVIAPANVTPVVLLGAIVLWGSVYVIPSLIILRKKKLAPLLTGNAEEQHG